MINDQSLKKLNKTGVRWTQQMITARLEKSMGALETDSEISKLLKAQRKDKSEYFAEAAKYSF